MMRINKKKTAVFPFNSRQWPFESGGIKSLTQWTARCDWSDLFWINKQTLLLRKSAVFKALQNIRTEIRATLSLRIPLKMVVRCEQTKSTESYGRPFPPLKEKKIKIRWKDSVGHYNKKLYGNYKKLSQNSNSVTQTNKLWDTNVFFFFEGFFFFRNSYLEKTYFEEVSHYFEILRNFETVYHFEILFHYL